MLSANDFREKEESLESNSWSERAELRVLIINMIIDYLKSGIL
jgi:hypothetical protein